MLYTPPKRGVYIWIISSKSKGYPKNHCPNIRLICIHVNAFYLFQIMAIKNWILNTKNSQIWPVLSNWYAWKGITPSEIQQGQILNYCYIFWLSQKPKQHYLEANDRFIFGSLYFHHFSVQWCFWLQIRKLFKNYRCANSLTCTILL